MRACFDRSTHLLPVDHQRATWADLRPLPRRDPDRMTHGDLVPGNLIVRDGRLAGVLDVGGLGAADPAVDLVVAWHTLDDAPRDAFRERLAVDDLRWQRGMAWAFEQAMGLVWYYETSNPTMSAIGRRTLDRILAAQPA
jgi:aminoglycoside phosphotransferase (APT) family kinase protein